MRLADLLDRRQVVADLKAAFADGSIADVSDPTYRNVVLMKADPDFWVRSLAGAPA